MTRIYSILICAIACLVFNTASNAQIFESDFSAWSNGVPTGWNGSRTNIGEENIIQIDNDIVVGDYGVRLVNTETDHKRFTTQPLSVNAGEAYEVTMYVRGTGQIRAGLFDNRPDAFGFVYQSWITVNSTEWATYSQTITAAETTNIAEFILSISNSSADAHVEVDYVVINTSVLETVSIYDIQYSEAADGSSPLADQNVTTGGIVSAVGAGGFFVQDGVGPWRGVFVFTNQTVSRGDSVIFSGGVVEYFNSTQISGVAGLTIVSSNNTVYTPAVIPTSDVNTEQYEGVLVTVQNATCTDANSGFGQWIVNDGSGSCLINSTIYTATRSQGSIYSVTGPVFYSFDEYKIMPRDAADVDGDTSVGEHNAVSQLIVFPNPSTETIQWNANGITLNGWVNITDMAGRTVLQSQVGTINPVLYVGGLTAGWYNLVLTTNNGTVQQARFLRQ
jgi:hypothetical protein